MPVTARRIIFYFLFILFFIIAPLLIAYTTGYRYSFTQRRLVKIGALSLTTDPAGTQVLINGIPHPGSTPLLVANLVPGNYAIEISKDGYHSWKKTLPVQSSKTTFAHAIRLFRQTVPRQVAPSPLQISPGLPDSFKQYRVFYDRTRRHLVVVDNDRQIRIAEIPGNKAIWRTDQNQSQPLLIVFSDYEVWQYNPKTGSRALVTRLSDAIFDVIALPDYSGMILIAGGSVRAVEADERGIQNSWELAKFDAINASTLDPDGRKLLIDGIFEKEKGIFELELR